MSNEKLEGKNTTNNVLTSKGTKVFHRRNKVKAAIVAISLMAGIGTGIGVGYAIFHKDTQPTPVYTFDIDPQSYENPANSVTWTANEYKDGVVIDTKSETIALTEDIVSLEITFADGKTNVFNVEWKYTSPTILTLEYSANSYTFFVNNENNSTGLPTLVDDLGMNASAHFELTSGILPEGLELNPNTGEISGNPEEIINSCPITITAYGIDKWTNINTSVDIILNITYQNTIILTDNTMVDITNPDGLMVSNSDSSTRLNNTTYTSAPIDNVNKIKEMYITPNQTIEEAPDYYGAYLFCDMEKLETVNIDLPQSIKTTGDRFCYCIFTNCSSLTKINESFTLPQSLTQINGTTFCEFMFRDCTSLETLPSNFNFPQLLEKIIPSDNQYRGFCDNMFQGCIKLTTLPENLNLPQLLTEVKHCFCECMFDGCESLKSLPNNFNLPQSLTSVEGNFCYQMFNGCTSLETLPDNFKLPQSIIEVGPSFCYSMFSTCTSIKKLPESFNLPQGITNPDTGFCACLFYDCTSLETLPNDFNLPQSITSVKNNFCYQMFTNCSALQANNQGQANFNSPIEVSGDANYYATNMFYGATKILEEYTGTIGGDGTPTPEQLYDGFCIVRNS